MEIDPTLLAKICSGAAAVIGGLVGAARLFRRDAPGDDSANPAQIRRHRKLVSLGWSVCAFLAMAIVVVMGSQIARVSVADLKIVIGIGVFLFAVICAGTWAMA